MAAIINDNDIILQAAATRFVAIPLPGVFTSIPATVTVDGTALGTTASAATAALSGLSNKLEASTSYALTGVVTPADTGALKCGTITWNATTGALTGGSGVALTEYGLIGAIAGVASFAIDTAGNATFSGALSAATGTFSGTVLAGQLKTATSGQRVTINDGNNNIIEWYADRGDGTVEKVAAMGTATLEGLGSVIAVGSANLKKVGLVVSSAYNYTAYLRNYGDSNVCLNLYASGVGTYGLISIGGTGASFGIWGTNYAGGAGSAGVKGTGAATGYAFYATGSGANYGPFTGSHDGLVPKDFTGFIGAIMIDVRVIHKANVSNAVLEMAISSAPKQKAARGVLVYLPQPLNIYCPPTGLSEMAFGPDVAVIQTSEDQWESFESLAENYNRICFNGVGEGLIPVCSEGGNLEIGDVICTSSTLGVGMKLTLESFADFLCIVAESRENVDWSTESSNQKMIACIYKKG